MGSFYRGFTVLSVGVLLYCMAIPVAAQQFSIKKYGLSDGLPQMQVMQVMQDSHGYIWIVTKKGLSKFDGVNFINYYRKDGLPNDLVMRVNEDDKGRIWVLADKGIVLYRGHDFETILTPEEVGLIRFTNSLEVFTNGNFLVGGFASDGSGGIYHINPSIPRIEGKFLNEPDYFYKLKVDGHIYLNSSEDEVFRWHPEGLQLLADSTSVRFSRQMDNVLWHSEEKYARIVGDTVLFHPYKPRRVDFIDLPFWGKIIGNSLLLYSQDTYTVIPWKNGWVNGVFTDRDGMHYLYGEDGLYKIVSDAFMNFNAEHPGVNKNIWSLVEDKEGRIWFNSLLGTIQTWDGHRLKDLNYQKNHNKVYFYMGSTRLNNGDLYITHGDGVLLYDGKNFSNVNWVKGQTQLVWQNPVNSHLLVSDCSQGLLIRERDSLKKFSSFNDNELGFVIDACVDQQDVYWFATEQKVVRMKNDSIIQFTDVEMPLLVSKAVACDSANRIWAGGNEGLFWYHREKEKFMPALPAEINSSVNLIHVMDDSTLLIGRYGDIVIIDLQEYRNFSVHSVENLLKRPWRIYGEAQGFYAGEIGEKGILKDREGYYWITGSEGVVRFNPDRLSANLQPPLIHITRVAGFNTLTREKKEVTLSPYQAGTPGDISFSHELKSISIDFDAISTRQPAKLLVQYSLNNGDWVMQENDHPLLLSGLSPGNYTLKLRAANEGIAWSDTAVVSFKILPALWQSTWFLAVIVLCFIALFIVGVQYRTRWLVKKEKQKQLYRDEINSLRIKSLQSQMNPHFVSNALNSIQYFVLKNDLDASVRFIQYFGKLLRITLNVLSLDKHTLEDEINYLESYINVENNRLTNKVRYNFEVEPGINPARISIPVMLIQPFVENFFKHGIKDDENFRPVLSIRFKSIGEAIKVEVEDNGPGYKATRIKYQGYAGHRSHATRITRDRIVNYNAGNKEIYKVQLIDLNETINKPGTLVVIVMPVTRQSAKPEHISTRKVVSQID